MAPAWGGDASGGGADALWANATMTGMTHRPPAAGRGQRLESELGYGLPIGSRFVGTPSVGLRTFEHGRSYRFGYGLEPLAEGRVRPRLGIEAERRESPAFGPHAGARTADDRVLGQNGHRVVAAGPSPETSYEGLVADRAGGRRHGRPRCRARRAARPPRRVRPSFAFERGCLGAVIAARVRGPNRPSATPRSAAAAGNLQAVVTRPVVLAMISSFATGSFFWPMES